MNPSDLLDLLAPHPCDDEHDAGAFLARRAIVTSMRCHADELERLVGALRVLPLTFAGNRFDLEIKGVEPELAALCLVLDEDEQPIDAIAWPIYEPSRFATFRARAVALGLPQLEAHSRSSLVEPLRVHPTPLAWLQAGGQGFCPVHPHRTAVAMVATDGLYAVRDDNFGVELQHRMAALVDRGRIVVDRLALEVAA